MLGILHNYNYRDNNKSLINENSLGFNCERDTDCNKSSWCCSGNKCVMGNICYYGSKIIGDHCQANYECLSRCC